MSERQKKLLLSGVFGPYGVDDAFGRRENIMELFHNQVTKAQGLASLRFHHRSFGLYFLAENVQAPVVVLDFPSRLRFIAELKRHRYDAVGISFIVPNFLKAREMARLVRRYQPQAEIILGGHGTSIEGIEQLIDCDHVVRGEGVRWLRRYLGEEEHAPIRHPTLISAEHKRIYGVPAPGIAGLLIPGVGCANGCRFCATTHFFGRRYIPYFSRGETLYREARRIAAELGTDYLFVMDENFLKNTERARELLACLERDQVSLRFMVFSSAETIEAFGVENLARLGVTFVWIGAESKHETYRKNAGLDLKTLVRQMRDYGIFVLVSGILFLEHHRPDNIQEDIDFLIDLEGVYTQFMMFTPLPGTTLYADYKARKLVDFELPYEEWHGQSVINWHHPHFTRADSTRILQQAFETEYHRLSSSVYRMLDTALRGYLTLKARGATDPWLAIRAEQMREAAGELRLLLPTMKRFAHDALERSRVLDVERRCDAAFGPPSLRIRGLQFAARVVAEAYRVRSGGRGLMSQPRTLRTLYRWHETSGERVPVRLPLAVETR